MVPRRPARPDSARIFVPPPLLYAGGLILGLAIDGRLHTDATLIDGPGRWIAAALAVAGAAFIAAGLGRFWSLGTPPEPWAPAKLLVTSGIYRWTRNSMYLGLNLLYAGLALLLWSPSAGALLVPLFAIMNFILIPREEAYLERRFGEDYRAYRRRTRRWL